MIVRESPKSRVTKNQPNWPPKSPHEALLSSPSGRRKYESQRERNSVSPSPTKRRPLSRGLVNHAPDDDEEEDDEDEDEETLQLKLKAIEARLKLKKLQKARRVAGETDIDDTRTSSRPGTAASLRGVEIPKPEPAVQVPVSPLRDRREPQEQKSPARVLLGIDKGLRARDVSLKRPASFQRGNASGTPALSRANSTRAVEAPRGKTFSERIAEGRNKSKEKDEKQARIEKSRSKGFGMNLDSLRDGASPHTASSQSSVTQGSQEQASDKRPSIAQSRSHSDFRIDRTSRPGSTMSTRSDPARAPSAASRAISSTPRPGTLSRTAAKYAEISERDDSTESASFESFSGLHLKTRTMQHNVLTRALDDKTVVTIPQLLKTVKAPDFDPPDIENDFVVMGVISSKSEPLVPKNARREQTTSNQEADPIQSGKFMVMRLTDLKWELDLFLFDTGFSQFWKLPIGTLVAILNPDIMPPRVRDTGKFSLKLASSDDTVLEIGTARDLDFCHARRKDGKECGQWIDGRKTEYCDFHIELQVEKSKRGRMEVNTMTGFGKGPGGGGGKFGMFGGGGRGGGLKSEDLKREGRFHDRSIHETVYIAPGAGAAAKLLDEDEQGYERGANREELHRKRLAEKEKERELAKKLGDMGRGAGADYMRLKGTGTPNLPARGDSRADFSAQGDQVSNTSNDFIGLLGRKADEVSLAPVKRKRIASGKSTTSSEPVGWGGAYKRGLLLSPKKDVEDHPRPVRESSPVKKKARLLLPEKGIREPGRDSLGTMDVGLLAAMDDDDEDDLEVV